MNRVDESDKSEFLSRQLDHYHHLRKQSLAVLRILVALASVFVLSLTTDTVQNYIENFSLVPQYLQNNPSQSFDILMAFLGLLVVIPSLVISIFAFTLALSNIVKIFTLESLHPGLGSHKQIFIPDNKDDSSPSDYAVWVNKNNILLNKMEKHYRYGVILLGFWILYMFVIAISLIGVHNRMTFLLIFLNGTFIMAAIAFFIIGILYIIRVYFGSHLDHDYSIMGSTLIVLNIIFGIDKDGASGLLHVFSLILIITQLLSSIIMIWTIYGWWQIS